MSHRKTLADYRALGKQRGIHWLGLDIPPTAQDKTIWECEKGHRWETTYDVIRQGCGCPICAGVKPKEASDYDVLGQEKGLGWLASELPANSCTKTLWQCSQGHLLHLSYQQVRRGKGCPLCSKSARKKPSDYHTLAAERGYLCLDAEVPNVVTKTTWQCAQGHQWQATYQAIRNGNGCPRCASQAPKEPSDYNILAEERGIRWLGPEVQNTLSRTTWQCQQGHKWETSYQAIRSGRGCPVCAGKKHKTAADYHAVGRKWGFYWLGKKVPAVDERTLWMCGEGHQWEARYSDIKRGIGCPFCSGKARKTAADYDALAKSRGYHWVDSEVPSSVLEKTTWECGRGHRWKATYANIQQGKGCPVCTDRVNGMIVSRIQRKLHRMIGGVLNHPVGGYSIDIALFVDGTKIAVEYDSWYWHANREDYDAMRERRLMADGWRILRIKSNHSLPNREQVDLAIAQLLADRNRVEIILDDWGDGPTRYDKA